MTDLNDSPRAKLLAEASRLITGDRNNQYGPPTQDFRRTGELLQALGYRGPNGRDMVSHDIAIIMIALKMSRIVWTPGKEDSWTDMAGYTGCGWECVVEEQAPAYSKFDPDAQNTEAVAGSWARTSFLLNLQGKPVALLDKDRHYWQPQPNGTWSCWFASQKPPSDDNSLSYWTQERVEERWGPVTVLMDDPGDLPWA